ncbi:MAG: hypothetical protein ACE5K2_09435, partial [Candidatus Zixiibacteriota bacterium]
MNRKREAFSHAFPDGSLFLWILRTSGYSGDRYASLLPLIISRRLLISVSIHGDNYPQDPNSDKICSSPMDPG